jgi:glycerate kinase
MKVVVATDSFKGRMTAEEACRTIRDAFLEVNSALEVVLKPMADGGEGTAAAMIAARGGAWVPVRVMGPLEDMQVDAGYARFPDIKSALVEMASASGLILLRDDQLNPLKTTTFGTGQLVQQAVADGVEHLWLAVGGSATVDGGVGAAAALGWSFLDSAGHPIGLGGGELQRIAHIEPPDDFSLPRVQVLCDVDNPLCGEHGAARVYAPQKGATPDMVEHLEAGLQHLADVVAAEVGKDIRDLPGAGASGGLSAGAAAFMNAELVSGIDTIVSASGLAEELATSDWVITGEGRFDAQSLRGKVVKGVAKAAAEAGTKVGVLAGSVEVTETEYRAAGIAAAVPTQKPGIARDYALEHARDLLFTTAQEFAGKHLVG